MIFISHKHNPDHETALEFKNILNRNGISCWIAPENVESGRDYAAAIPEAINACEYFLLILTEEMMKSAHVRKEIDIALRQKKKILPIKLGDFELDASYDYLLADVQIMSFGKTEKDYQELVDLCKLGERVVRIETSRRPSRSLSVIKGDFQDNMAYYIEKHADQLGRTVFAMGIDRSTDLVISSKKGILRWVCQYLCDDYHITVETLQQLVNDAKMEQLNRAPEEWIDFKDTLLIKVPLGDEGMYLQLLLIANSQKNSRYITTNDVDEVEGIDSRQIIIEVFNKCKELGERAEILFIGAMGTNGLAFPYEVITAEIMNCFVYSQRVKCVPYNLYYSVREADMKQTNLTLDEILSYITRVLKFFS